MTLAAHARRYSELGWALVALDGKTPRGHGWQRAHPLDPDDAHDIWSRRGSDNMGMVLGPSGVIDFELDAGDENLYWALAWTPSPTPIFFTGSGKPHVLFKDPGGLSRRTRDGLELRAGPHQSVLPPSIHPETGKRYEWKHDPTVVELQPPPQKLLDFFSASNNGPSESHWRQPLNLGRKLGEGEGRHHSLISFCGRMKYACDTPDQLVQAALVYSEMHHDPPYPEDHIVKQALYVWDEYREVPEDPEEAEEYLKVVTADKISMKSVDFLWKPYLQKSAFHLLVGRKGVGKGSVLAWIAANMTVGTFEDDTPSDVLWIATEDSFEIDVKPRFMAQGGLEQRLWCVRQPILLPRDIPAIRAHCVKHKIGLLVIDPMAGSIGDADSNSEGPVIAAIGGLNQLADELNMTIIGVRHTGKNDSILGSVAWMNSPRAVLEISQNQDSIASLRVMISNRVRSRDAKGFKIEQATVNGVGGVVPKATPMG